MKIQSNVFTKNGAIPQKYTCEGPNINPPLTFFNIPEQTKSLALIVEDPDAVHELWTHWILFNIPPTTNNISENSIPRKSTVGYNSSGTIKYQGPCPPSGSHRYFFKLYALNATLTAKPLTREELLREMENHIIEKAELLGMYQLRKNK